MLIVPVHFRKNLHGCFRSIINRKTRQFHFYCQFNDKISCRDAYQQRLPAHIQFFQIFNIFLCQICLDDNYSSRDIIIFNTGFKNIDNLL